MTLPFLLTVGLGLLFLIYGGLCLGSSSMIYDFDRFGLQKLRRLTGCLEVAGGLGLLVGLRWRPVLRLSASGLALLMLIAFAIRLRFKDSIRDTLPSASLMLANVYILIMS